MSRRNRDTNEEPLESVINRLLKAYGLEEGYYAAAIVTHWEKMMGPAIARRTKEVKLEKGKLIIWIESASLRQELSYAKDRIAEKINREMGQRLVQSVELR
jgi:predicted nucleic acid-binding Zn ribbon protein